jgi:hypothetical protein
LRLIEVPALRPLWRAGVRASKNALFAAIA